MMMVVNKKYFLIFLSLMSVRILFSQQKIKTERWPDYGHFLKQDYSDTNATYLDASNKLMHYTNFWLKLSTEGWALKIIIESNKQTIKQLQETQQTKLIGSFINFDSIDYRYTGKKPIDFKNKKVVLIFFSPGCFACNLLDKDLTDIKKQFPDITFVHLTDKPSKWVIKYLKEHEIFETLLMTDTYNKSKRRAITWSAPTVLFLNNSSKVEALQLGYLVNEYYRQLFKEKLQAL
jgi:thioredoxin-related protein